MYKSQGRFFQKFCASQKVRTLNCGSNEDRTSIVGIHPSVYVFLFQAHLGLSREDFMAAPRWKQLEIRKEKGLF